MVKDAVVQAMVSLALIIFASILALAGLGFLVAGGYLYLERYLPPAGAAACTGAGLLLLTMIFVLIAKGLIGRATPGSSGSGSAGNPLESMLRNGQMAGSNAEKVIRDHFPLVAGSAFAAGFAIGVSPEVRSSVGKGLSSAADAAVRAAESASQ